MRTFNHRLGWTVTVLEWFSEGHFTAVLSIHQCWEPTWFCPWFLEWLECTHDRSTVYLTSLTGYLKCTVNQHVEVWLFCFSEDCVRKKIKLATGMDQRETTVLNTDTLCCWSTRGNSSHPTKASHQGMQDGVQYSQRVMENSVCERCWLHLWSQRCTELRRMEIGDCGKEWSADRLGVFSSNACQHLKVLEELLLSPGTCRKLQAMVLNAEQFRRKC